MAIRINCSCGKTLSVRDEAAGKMVKCPGCDAMIGIPGGPKEIILEEAPKEKGTCKSCGEGSPDVMAPCPKCGWNERKQERRCLSCGGPIVVTYVGNGFALGSMALAVVCGVLFVILFGPLIAAAFVSLAAASGGALLAATLRYECGMCGIAVPADALGASESVPLRKKRKTSMAGAGVLGAVAFGFVLLSISAGVAPHIKDPDADLSVVERAAKAAKAAREKPPEPKNPPGTAKVQVDNRTPNIWTVWVDGSKKGIAKPYTFFEFKIPSGIYELKVTEGEKVIDTVKGDIYRTTRSQPKVNVFTPGGGEYMLVDRDYSNTQSRLSETSRRERFAPTESLFVVNFGLGEPSPYSVYIQPPETRRTTAKLVRALPLEPSPEEAIAFFSALPYVYTDTKIDAERALSLFLSAASDEQRREMLPRCVVPEREELIAVVTPLLAEFADELSDEVLVGWLVTPLEGRVMRVGERDRMTMVAGALLSSGRGALLGKNLMGLEKPLYMVAYVKIVAADGKARRALIDGLIEKGPGYGTDSMGFAREMQKVIDTKDFEIDQDFVKRMNGFIGGIASAKAKGFWNAWWSRKVTTTFKE